MRITSITPMLVTALALTAAHGLLAAWFGIKLSDRIGGWFPLTAAATLIAFGLYHVIHKLRGKGLSHSHLFGGRAPDHTEVERGPHDGPLVNLGHGFVEVAVSETDVPSRFRLFFYDKHKQARSVPRNAAVTIETARPDGARQTFAFCAKGDYLESTNDIPEPCEFKAMVQVSHGSHTHTHDVEFSERDQLLGHMLLRTRRPHTRRVRP